MKAVLKIAQNTFRECLRQPIYTVLLLTTVLIVTFTPTFTLYVFREQEKLVTDVTMATVLTFGWILAALAASHSISKEIDTGTVLLILSKPVNRPGFIIAKTLGLLTALTVFLISGGICSLVAVRVAKDQFRIDFKLLIFTLAAIALAALFGAARNYYGKKSFGESFAKSLLVCLSVLGVVVFFLPKVKSGHYDWEHMPGGYDIKHVESLILVFMAVWAMGSLATCFSTRFNGLIRIQGCNT